MSRVISRICDIRYEGARSRVLEILESLDHGMIQKGARVLIKPNLLAPASPEKAMVTHPAVVRAVAEYVLQRGGRVRISDSPAMGSLKRVVRESGIEAVLEGLDVEFREFKTSVPVDVGAPFHKIEIARAAMEADVFINLPKLKTHTQMFLTLGVKNLFGCVVGFRKPQWHLRVGVDREMFGVLLYRIHTAIRPAITILDGVLAMEGQGPGRGGTPRKVGVLMGSRDAVAIDATVCTMLGVDSGRLFTNQAAMNAGEMPNSIDVEGELPFISGFVFPQITPLVFGPKGARKYLRKYLIQRPVAMESLCRTCGECWRYCPAGAIFQENKKLRFDYDKCIRCYCCLEVCPHGALTAQEPTLGKLFNKFIRITS